MSKDVTMPYTSSNLFIISATGSCRPSQLWFHVRICYCLPQCCLCVTLHHTPNFKSPLFKWDFPPFWEESPLNVLNFGILPTTWEATLGQKISHCGSSIGLGNCMFVPSTNTFSSLSTQCNWSPIIICSGDATLHPVFTLQPHHISLDCSVLHNFPISSPFQKTNKVFLPSSLCTTIGSSVVSSYTNPAMMSWFINAGDNAFPLSNSTVKTTAVLLLSQIRISGILSYQDNYAICITIISLKVTLTVPIHILHKLMAFATQQNQ